MESQLTELQRHVCRKLRVSRAGYALRCAAGVHIGHGLDAPGVALSAWDASRDNGRPIDLKVRFGWPKALQIPGRLPVVAEGGELSLAGADTDVLRLTWRAFRWRGELAGYAYRADTGRHRFGISALFAHRVESVGKWPGLGKWRGSHWTWLL